MTSLLACGCDGITLGVIHGYLDSIVKTESFSTVLKEMELVYCVYTLTFPRNGAGSALRRVMVSNATYIILREHSSIQSYNAMHDQATILFTCNFDQRRLFFCQRCETVRVLTWLWSLVRYWWYISRFIIPVLWSNHNVLTPLRTQLCWHTMALNDHDLWPGQILFTVFRLNKPNIKINTSCTGIIYSATAITWV